MDEKIAHSHSFGTDHYLDWLYFTVILEDVETLLSLGNGDEKVNYLDDKNVYFYVFLLVKINTLSIFSHN